MSVRDADNHKLSLHPDRLTKWMNDEPCYPLHIELGITNRCNHNCKFCILDWVNHGIIDINTEILIKNIDDFSKIGVKSIYFAGEGEPTLHPDLDKFIDKAHSLNIKSALSTNGSKFEGEIAKAVIEKMSWVRFSLDAFKPSTYKALHGVGTIEYYKVLQNIATAVKLKRDLKSEIQIGVQAVFEPINADEMLDMGKMLREIGVDNFQIKPAHAHPKSSYKPDIYDFSSNDLPKQLEDLQTENFIVVVRLDSLNRLKYERNYKECHAFNFYGIIDARGNVIPCSIFYNNPAYTYGNINDQLFSEIWLGDKKKQIMQNITCLNNKFCGNYRCRLDVMNRYLQRLKTPEINDEFI